ncbi:twin-arginine translocase TatA/TatE family subunit [Mariprofundus ferrooxydans]|nr:twin-arginine translocase TatA/TatE family subunit [Mariprofundus ferrooxydans]
MPDIGLVELLFIGVIAFLVLGPDRLPEFFSQMARFVRLAKAWVSDLKQQFDQEKQQFVHPVEEMKQQMHDSVEDVKSDLSAKVEIH